MPKTIKSIFDFSNSSNLLNPGNEGEIISVFLNPMIFSISQENLNRNNDS